MPPTQRERSIFLRGGPDCTGARRRAAYFRFQRRDLFIRDPYGTVAGPWGSLVYPWRFGTFRPRFKSGRTHFRLETHILLAAYRGNVIRGPSQSFAEVGR